jgi:uncharacterized protein YecE (DUF72 family)
MTSLHVGAVIERPPGPKYHAALDFAELAPRPPLPKPKTSAKVREDLPDGFVLALSAPRSTFVSARGPLRIDDGLEGEIAWLADTAKAIDARVVVVPTLGEVRTGPKDRERLEAYFALLRNALGDVSVVWEAGGLWEQDEARRLADEMSVAYAFDPLDAELQRSAALGSRSHAGSLAYLRVRGMGARTRLGEGALSMVVDAIERLSDAREIFVAIESQRSVREATRLKQLLATE